jgi:hypothetical protein
MKALSVLSAGGTISIPFADFTGGKPAIGVDPKQIVAIRWGFSWADGASPCVVDAFVDNVAFTP